MLNINETPNGFQFAEYATQTKLNLNNTSSCNVIFMKNKRKELFETCLRACPNLAHLTLNEKFIWIMTNENKQALKSLGKFIWQSFEDRKSKLKAKSQTVLVPTWL